jgi:hypothetical protein
LDQLPPITVVRMFLAALNNPQGPQELSTAGEAELCRALQDNAARSLFVQGIAAEVDLEGLSSFARARLPDMARSMRIGNHRVWSRPQVERIRELDELRRSFAPYRALDEPSYRDRYGSRRERRRKPRGRLLYFEMIGPR